MERGRLLGGPRNRAEFPGEPRERETRSALGIGFSLASRALNPPRSYDALVLAGTRGDDDELARATQSSHRALLDLEGIPMLERVVATLERTPAIDRIWVSIDAPHLLSETAGLAQRVASQQIGVLTSEASPSASVQAALEGLGLDRPLLVTTADHALLDIAIVEHFLNAAEASEADLAVGVVAENVIRKRFPTTRRTYLRFRGERFSGANLFALRTQKARHAVQFWRRAEQHRKRPWRLIGAFGPVSLLLFALRRLDLDQAVTRASKILDAKLSAIQMPQPEAALDVDRLEDYQQVLQILGKRHADQPNSLDAPP